MNNKWVWLAIGILAGMYLVPAVKARAGAAA